MLDTLEEVFRELGIDFYMLGATAKEYWYRQGNKLMRQTRDIDFAVLVSGREMYKAVRERLKDHQFAVIRENDFAMHSPNGLQVDLLPFGEISINDDLSVASEALTNMSVNGFMEVYEAGTVTAEMETGHSFKAATLPAILLLKLIAYDDRPEQRQKDARDAASIIQHYFDLQPDHIYEHNDLFDENAQYSELPEIAAIVIGREIKKMCQKNPALKTRLASILAGHITKGQRSSFVKQMVAETRKPVDEMLRQLTALQTGLL